MPQNRIVILVIFSLLAAVSLLSFMSSQFRAEIPKTWDLEQLRTMHLPYADSTAHIGFLSEELYNKLPVELRIDLTHWAKWSSG